MGYTTPQRIIDRSAAETLAGGQKVASSMSEVASLVKKQKEDQDKIVAENDEAQQTMFAQVNKFGSTGVADLDKNIVNYWNGKVEEYFDIKNKMDNGEIPRTEGNRQLAVIESMPDKFGKITSYLATQNASFAEDSKIKRGMPGSISSTSSQESQRFLQYLTRANITDDGNGNFRLFVDEFTDENGNVINEGGARLDGNKLLALEASGEGLYTNVEDISAEEQELFNTLNVDEVGSEWIQEEEVEEGDKIYVKRTWKDRDGALSSLQNSPAMNAMIDDKDLMTSYFQDVIPDEGDVSLSSFYDSDAPEAQALRDAGVSKDDFVNSRWQEAIGSYDDPANDAIFAAQDVASRQWLANDTMNKYEPGMNKIDKGSYAYVKQKEKPDKYDPYANLNAATKNDIITRGDDYENIVNNVQSKVGNDGKLTTETAVEILNSNAKSQGWSIAGPNTVDSEGNPVAEGTVISPDQTQYTNVSILQDPDQLIGMIADYEGINKGAQGQLRKKLGKKKPRPTSSNAASPGSSRAKSP